MGQKNKRRDEYATFSKALQKVLRVSHVELKSRLDAEKVRKQRVKPASGHASSGSH